MVVLLQFAKKERENLKFSLHSRIRIWFQTCEAKSLLNKKKTGLRRRLPFNLFFEKVLFQRIVRICSTAK